MDIRAADRADTTRMGELLAAAFAASPTFQWIFPDAVRRPALMRAFFTGTIRHAHPPGRGTLVAEQGGRIIGVAAWVPPGRWKPPWWRGILIMPGILRAGDRRSLQTFGERGPGVDEALTTVHPTEPHWYLAALATDPTAQGAGAGSALIRAGLLRADDQRIPTYLECEEHLIGYYESFGFGVVHECPMPDSAPRQWGMRRAPDA
ncbi:MAG: GNAT family N-acetyltransferase [Actinomycetia bacterium]|nr:GNAT family N-acetyltransferase [Actinomycetes bacterium]